MAKQVKKWQCSGCSNSYFEKVEAERCEWLHLRRSKIQDMFDEALPLPGTSDSMDGNIIRCRVVSFGSGYDKFSWEFVFESGRGTVQELDDRNWYSTEELLNGKVEQFLKGEISLCLYGEFEERFSLKVLP